MSYTQSALNGIPHVVFLFIDLLQMFYGEFPYDLSTVCPSVDILIEFAVVNVPGPCPLLLVCMHTNFLKSFSRFLSRLRVLPGYCASTVYLLGLRVAGTVSQTFLLLMTLTFFENV